MTIHQQFDCFKLENCASIYQRIQVKKFAEALEIHLQRDFQLGVGKAAAQLSLVNFLVEETPKFIVNVEYAPHHIVSDFAKGRLIQSLCPHIQMNRHKDTSDCGSLFFSPTSFCLMVVSNRQKNIGEKDRILTQMGNSTQPPVSTD